jgi:sterol 3beta-glucosyltransferase
VRVLIATTGPRAEVGPHLGLGRRLAEAGHDVVIATHRPFESWVTGLGLEFRALPDDPRDDALAAGGAKAAIRGFKDGVRALCAGLRDAARHGADVVLLSDVMIIGGYHVAEGLGIPSAGLLSHPGHPSREFPPPDLSGLGSLGGWGNWLSARLLFPVAGVVVKNLVDDLRAEGGLRPIGIDRVYREQRDRQWPVLYTYSPYVQPKPADWRAGLEVVGYLWPPDLPGWQPRAALADFLAAGPPPVFIDLDGVPNADAELLGNAITTAGFRAVVRKPLAAGEFTVIDDDVPLSWLLPRMTAAVHQADSAVTAACLRAGVPSVAAPSRLVQPYWAARLVKLGAGVTIRAKRLSADGLGAALRSLTSEHRDRAGAAAAHLSQEDGCGHVVAKLKEWR